MSSMIIDGNYASGEKLEQASFMVKHVDFKYTLKCVAQALPESQLDSEL